MPGDETYVEDNGVLWQLCNKMIHGQQPVHEPSSLKFLFTLHPNYVEVEAMLPGGSRGDAEPLAL